METKKLDLKSWFIIILGAALCISFWFGQKNNIDDHADEIKMLHASNTALLKTNDSISIANKNIDIYIMFLEKKLLKNEQVLSDTKKELQKLKNKQNEIPHYVNHLSANGVASAFSNYLTKSTNTR